MITKGLRGPPAQVADSQRNILVTFPCQPGRALIKSSRMNTKIKVGDIFKCSWGYDQTNVDFYQVTKLNKATVTVCQINAHTVESGMMCGETSPIPGLFIGEPMVKRLKGEGDNTCFRVNSFSHAFLTNPKDWHYTSWYA